MPYRGETYLSIKLGTQSQDSGKKKKTKKKRIKHQNRKGKYSRILLQVCWNKITSRSEPFCYSLLSWNWNSCSAKAWSVYWFFESEMHPEVPPWHQQCLLLHRSASYISLLLDLWFWKKKNGIVAKYPACIFASIVTMVELLYKQLNHQVALNR